MLDVLNKPLDATYVIIEEVDMSCTRFISDTAEPVTIYPLYHLRVIKDLVPDLTHLFTQFSLIEPWLQTTTPEPEKERLQSRQDRSKLDPHYECILCFCGTSGCPSHWWNGDRFLGPAVLLQAYRRLADSRDRHLVWDAGYGFELRTVYASGWAVVMASTALIIAAWIFSFVVMG